MNFSYRLSGYADAGKIVAQRVNFRQYFSSSMMAVACYLRHKVSRYDTRRKTA